MTRNFDTLLAAYSLCLTSRADTGLPSTDYVAARAELPLSPQREFVRDLEPALVASSWAGGVGDAAQRLANLVHIHDNGGTASSPAKIKRAALELVRLLGEN